MAGREFLIDIYNGLTDALGVDIEPNFGPDRAGDIKHSNADISKARQMLGYDPEWSFERRVKAVIEWYRVNLKKKCASVLIHQPHIVLPAVFYVGFIRLFVGADGLEV